MTTTGATAKGTVRGHADTAMPRVVSAEDWRQARDQLLIAEKAHTHAGDAVAAQRRRLPMTEVDATLEATGPDGPTSLLDMFDGRRQLIVYHHMLEPDDEHPCPGCSAFTDHVPHLAHLNATDVTFAMEAAAPLDQFQAYMDRMGRPDIPVYSSAGGRFRDELHPSPHGTGSFGLSVFLRDGKPRLPHLLDPGPWRRRCAADRPDAVRQAGVIPGLTGGLAAAQDLHLRRNP